MKQVVLEGGRTIETPWMNSDEAMAYCCMKKKKFERVTKKYDVPYSGSPNARTWNQADLDVMMQKMRNTQAPPGSPDGSSSNADLI
ncbi:hypothetical protein [Desulfatibacillum aliphaticivorans]|uniref:hypothetical protein n=1 Tax=Desulfatibacillum aliphaticivorans TaxID=218208 RepID=UPI00041183FC|nr:hypothetical protein [Desulfatibacillum aliphaticivorans]